MSTTQASHLETELQQLECHFTWELKKEDADITDLLNRLEQHIEFNLGGKSGVAQTYNSLAFVRYLLGCPTEALSNVQKSIELTGEHRQKDGDKWLVVSYGNLAWLHYHRESYPECESYLEKLREIAENFPTESDAALHHEVLGEKAWALFKFSRKYYERAKESFRQALELEPRDPQWNTGYAVLLHRTDTRSCSSAADSTTVKQLHQAIDTDPENDELKAILAVRLAQFKENDEAESLVARALEGSPNASHVIRYVGKFLMNYGSVDSSIALLKRALEKSPNSGFIHHQLACCYKKKKITLQKSGNKNSSGVSSDTQRLLHQCIHHLEKATTLKICFIPAMIDLAGHYGEDGQPERADQLYRETLHLAKEKNEFLQKCYIRYGDFQLYKKSSQSLAIQNYEECLKLGYGSTDGKRSADKLTKIANTFFLRNQEVGRAWAILGFIHKAKRENSRARECYENALQFDFSNDEYLSALCELKLSL